MKPKLNEVTLADKLADYRSKQSDFMGLSFDTIAGVGEHGAIIHYRATEKNAKEVNTKELILLDSGAQYRDGTTDITRTFHLGTPTDWQKHTFTLVLKGHIALANAIFPQTVVGPSLDALARQFLWREGLEYMHGTGHGVGAFLNVHEGVYI
jgi:Xaa-Pro aminopeptidase